MASRARLEAALAPAPGFPGGLRGWGNIPPGRLAPGPGWWLPLQPPVMLASAPPAAGVHRGLPVLPYAAGFEEAEAGRLPTSWGQHSTIVLILQAGGGITWTGGLVAACALLEGRVRLGVRRYPTGPPSDVLRYRGTPPDPRRGLRPLHPCLGNGGVAVACALIRRRDWLGLRRCPTCPPSNVFGNRGTPPVTPGGNRGSLHPPLRDG